MSIYLDNAATTRPYPEVVEIVRQCQQENFGNASSLNKPGIKAAQAVETARLVIAGAIHGRPEHICFTSGGTEANNAAVLGVAFAAGKDKNHIITSQIEHPSVYETVKWLGTKGFETTCLPVDKNGFVSPTDLRRAIKKRTLLVSIMHANNEIGTLEPIAELGRLCRERKVYFHTDACQSFTKTELNVGQQYLDLVSLNAHKIHGPKGVGALYMRPGVHIHPLMHGGGQEADFRSGTYNTPGIAGFGKAVEISKKVDQTAIRRLRDDFISRLREHVEGFCLNGPEGDKRLANNVGLHFRNVNGKRLFTELNRRGIFISTGSACSSTKLTPSRVLLAIGQDHETAQGAIRISTSPFTTQAELDAVVNALIEIVGKERGQKGSFQRP